MDLQHCLLFDVLCLQDSEEITNIELADAFQQMWAKRRYNEIFFMIDTCQVFLPSDTGLSSILLAVVDGHLSLFYYVINAKR
jgi:glycosylphosphatidylinositol transamidase (GPIT) subunit GPI8